MCYVPRYRADARPERPDGREGITVVTLSAGPLGIVGFIASVILATGIVWLPVVAESIGDAVFRFRQSRWDGRSERAYRRNVRRFRM